MKDSCVIVEEWMTEDMIVVSVILVVMIIITVIVAVASPVIIIAVAVIIVAILAVSATIAMIIAAAAIVDDAGENLCADVGKLIRKRRYSPILWANAFVAMMQAYPHKKGRPFRGLPYYVFPSLLIKIMNQTFCNGIRNIFRMVVTQNGCLISWICDKTQFHKYRQILIFFQDMERITLYATIF